ncbi:MAG: hypothetical protein NTY41_12185, partial [Proteobacteria bacterium]|nr:hypothetical protein [Pseudomonadota bacterium]
MVSVIRTPTQADVAAGAGADTLSLLAAGLPAEGRERIEKALTLVSVAYGESLLGTGESSLSHAVGMASVA